MPVIPLSQAPLGADFTLFVQPFIILTLKKKLVSGTNLTLFIEKVYNRMDFLSNHFNHFKKYKPSNAVRPRHKPLSRCFTDV